MQRGGVVTRVLAVAGTVLLCVPLLAPVVLADWTSVGTERFNFDWLMPAELFPAMLLGAALLLWAAVTAQSRRGLVAWGLGVAVGSLGVGLLLASVTGLASGAVEPRGLPVILVDVTFAVYAAAIAEMAVAGVLLSRDLLGRHDRPVPPGASADADAG